MLLPSPTTQPMYTKYKRLCKIEQKSHLLCNKKIKKCTNASKCQSSKRTLVSSRVHTVHYIFITFQCYFTVSPKVFPEPEKINHIISTFYISCLSKSFASSFVFHHCFPSSAFSLCCVRWHLLPPYLLPPWHWWECSPLPWASTSTSLHRSDPLPQSWNHVSPTSWSPRCPALNTSHWAFANTAKPSQGRLPAKCMC